MSWKRNVVTEAKKLIEMYPEKRSALGPLLYLALREDGYISNDSIKQISELIGITEAQVQSVSTFYSMYKQDSVGKYLISVSVYDTSAADGREYDMILTTCLLYTSPSPRDS